MDIKEKLIIFLTILGLMLAAGCLASAYLAPNMWYWKALTAGSFLSIILSGLIEKDWK